MIPLKDIDRKPSRFPIITTLIIVTNVFVFLLELANGPAFVIRWSYIPSKIMAGQNLSTLLTAMFVHAGWLHIIGNMVFFWAFGPEIEDMMGRARYLTFYMIGGLVATFSQLLMTPNSSLPNLGASGAIAAVMGAFLVTFPQDRIRTIVFLGIFVTILFIPAVLLVGFWFLLQLFSEVGSLAIRRTDGGTAYAAHIGGFVFGMAFARLFDSRRRRYLA
jgi:membrane associated rhomboid family serine protease